LSAIRRAQVDIIAEPHRVPIHDIRPISDTVSLDREGFALVLGKKEFGKGLL